MLRSPPLCICLCWTQYMYLDAAPSSQRTSWQIDWFRLDGLLVQNAENQYLINNDVNEVLVLWKRNLTAGPSGRRLSFCAQTIDSINIYIRFYGVDIQNDHWPDTRKCESCAFFSGYTSHATLINMYSDTTMNEHTPLKSLLSAGSRLNIKTVFLGYGDSHVKDKMVARPSYL